MLSFYLLVFLFSAQVPQADSPSDSTPSDPLALLHWRATEGAAAGYVEDKACSTCHMELYLSYQKVGMSKSLVSPAEASPLEDFGKEFYHEPSQRYYRIDKVGDKLTFYRYQRDRDGKPINTFETPIAWVVGSGNRARSYLYRTEWGELFMLPFGWYSQTGEWGMSPGAEGAEHFGIQRRVMRECMFCHNGFPEVPEGSDAHWEVHTFPKELPHGTGCQRCHGPGAEHIRAGLTGKPYEEIRSKIVNPRKLPVEERDSVCFQCHMLPTVSMVGSRRFDRDDYSFRPGQKFSEYLLHVETTEADATREERFEINHHGYRFWQSQCYQKSLGKLACITCHNPHVKPPSIEFRADVSQKCRSCHQQPGKLHQQPIQEDGDCVACHMPTRRTRDVILVTMTDHRIARGPFDLDQFQKPIVRTDPVITELNLLPWSSIPEKEEAQIYRAVTALRARSTKDATNALKNLLIKTQYPSITPYLDLLDAELSLRRYADAENTAQFLLNSKKENFYPTLMRLGVSQIGQGKRAEGINALQRSLAIRPTPEAFYNLGLAFYGDKQYQQSLEQLEKAIEMRANMHSAWLYKGRLLVQLGRKEDGAKALKRALEISPRYTVAYQELVQLLRSINQAEEAERYLELGLRVSAEPDDLKSLAR